MNKILTFPPPFRQQPCINTWYPPRRGLPLRLWEVRYARGRGKKWKVKVVLDWLEKVPWFFLYKEFSRVSILQFCKSTLLYLVNKMFSFSSSLPTTTVYLLSIGSNKQCVAVSTQFGLISEPPQLWSPPILREIIHGQELAVALTPPITRPLIIKGRTPHPTWK